MPVQALSTIRHGGINLQPSLLLAYRGSDPLTWQVVDRVDYLSMSVHRLVERNDAGSILAQFKERRPREAHRQELVQRIEGDVGCEFLNQIVGSFAGQEDVAEVEQPASSPTRTANKLMLKSVGDSWALNDSDVDQV